MQNSRAQRRWPWIVYGACGVLLMGEVAPGPAAADVNSGGHGDAPVDRATIDKYAFACQTVTCGAPVLYASTVQVVAGR